MRTELILVLPSKYVEFEGVFKDPKQTFELLQEWKNKLCFMPRYMAEEWPEWKQIIPYILITDGEKYFVYQRTKKGNEERLHNMYSLGIGGHIDINDAMDAIYDLNSQEFPAYGAIPIGTWREFSEEIILTEDNADNSNFELVGLLNDNSNEVGKVHLGLVTKTIVPKGSVEVREKNKLIGQWMTIEEIKEIYNSLESWSKIVFDEFVQK